MSNLDNAIQLIRKGQKLEAQQILQGIIKNDPQNIQAWFWYVETCTTTEKRVQALETCLKMNPGNQQVINALRGFQNQSSAIPQKPIDNSSLSSNQSQYQDSYYTSDFTEETKDNYFEEENIDSSYSLYTSAPVKALTSQKKPWEMDPSEYVDNSMLSKPKKLARSYSTLDVWATVLTVQDVKVYEDILKDPNASIGRAFAWIAIAGFVSALLFPLLVFINPQFPEIASMTEFQNITSGSTSTVTFLLIFTLILLVIMPIGLVINTAITGGIQNFLAIFFGGTGNFTRTIYAIAAFLAPITILSSLLVIIPYVGQCLAFPLAIYNVVLNVRALKAAHFISTGAAIGVILSPTILVLIFFCLLLFFSSGVSFS